MLSNNYVLGDDMVYFADKLREMSGLDTPLSFPDDFLYACEKVCGIEQLVTNWAEGKTMNIDYDFPFITTLTPFFRFDQGIVSISLPNCSQMYTCAFQLCSNLTYVYAPECKAIGANAFEECRALSYIYAPEVGNIQAAAFRMCESLESVYFPKCTAVHGSAFQGCSILTSVVMPSLSSIGALCFAGTNLEEADFPLCSMIQENTFNTCTNLKSVYLSKCSLISLAAFFGCTALESLVLLSSKVVEIYNYSTTFASTPILSSEYLGYWGSIYVPESLVSAYQAHLRWKYLSSRICAYISN